MGHQAVVEVVLDAVGGVNCSIALVVPDIVVGVVGSLGEELGRKLAYYFGPVAVPQAEVAVQHMLQGYTADGAAHIQAADIVHHSDLVGTAYVVVLQVAMRASYYVEAFPAVGMHQAFAAFGLPFVHMNMSLF